MATELATRGNGVASDAAVIEQVLATGDLEKLSAAQRVAHYLTVCESLGLNHLTQPFQYIRLNGKLTFYATRGATDQLRGKSGVSVVVTDRQRIDDLYVVSARATLPNGRTDESIGAVSIAGLKGEALANALMKAETKAKRRVTLSACGLGWSDESEVGSIPGARLVTVDPSTGEIVGEQPVAGAHVGEPQAADETAPNLDAIAAELERIVAAGRNAASEADVEWLRGLPALLGMAAVAAGVTLPERKGPKTWDGGMQWAREAIAVLRPF